MATESNPTQRTSIALVAGLALLASTGATARTTALTDAARDALKGQAVVLAAHKLPTFVAHTAGKAAFAVLGAAAMLSEGERIVA